MSLPEPGRLQGMKNSRWLSLVVLCTGFLLIVVDMTIVNVALPSIQRDLGFSQSGLAWVINAYLIAFAGLLLLAGRLGDLFGRKRVYLIGLGIFTSASVLCGLSFDQRMLVAARFVQGIGGAVSSAGILAMIITLFPRPDDQARAFGVFSFVASAGAAVGLLAGGLITQAVSWHWIFFVNLPIGVATTAVSARLLGSDRGSGAGDGADVLGAILVTASLMIGVYAIVESSTFGLSSLHMLGFGALSMATLAAFVVRQALGRNPILPLRLFAARRLAGANLVQALMTSAFFGFFFLGSLDLERVLGYGPMAIGLAFLPVAAVMAVFSIWFSARLITRFGPGTVLFTGQGCGGGPCAPRFGALEAGVRGPPTGPAGTARPGWWPLVPGADHRCHVRHRAGRRGPGVGSTEHHGPGRRRPRSRGIRDARRVTDPEPGPGRRG